MTVRMSSLVVVACIAIVAISAQAGGPKKTAESCTKDDDCSRGHSYTKQNGDKVCVDCSSSDIGNYRGQIQRYCKDEPEVAPTFLRQMKPPKTISRFGSRMVSAVSQPAMARIGHAGREATRVTAMRSTRPSAPNATTTMNSTHTRAMEASIRALTPLIHLVSPM